MRAHRRTMLAAATAALFATSTSMAWAQAKPYAGTRLSVLMEAHPTTDGIKSSLPDFKAATGIEVDLEVVTETEITPKILLDFSAKTGRYDVVQNNIIYIPGFVKAGYIEPLDALAKQLPAYFDPADMVPGYLKTSRLDNKLFGLPLYGESTFLMYRKDIFKEYGIAAPKTFDEVEAAAKTVHQKSGGKVAGVTLRGLQGIHSVYVWAGWLWGFGGEFVDSNGKSAIASPQAQSALEAYARLLREYGPKGFTKNAWTENRNLFIQGKAAMTLDATVNGAFNEDPQISNVVGKVGYVPVPVQAGIKAKGGAGSLAAHSLYVSAESKKKEAAWLFMSWATSKDQQIKSLALAPNSGVTSMAAMASKEFTSRYGAFKDAMVASINQGNPQYLPTVGAANEIINSTGVAVSKVLNGRASAKVALEVADKANAIALSR